MVVLGAGLAGLTAAYELLKLGLQRGQDKKVFDVTFNASGQVLQATLGDDERQTQPGG